MHCTRSTFITIKSTLDDPTNVKVVIFRNILARRYRNMRGAHKKINWGGKCEAAEKSERWTASQIKYQGNTDANL